MGELEGASPVQHRKFDSADKEEIYFIQKNGVKARLEVHPEDDGSWCVFDCRVGPKREGLGKHLLKEFVRDVGSGIDVHGPITHKDTISFLRKKGTFQGVTSAHDTFEPLVVTDEVLLRSVPIIKFLNSGGIQVSQLELGYDIESPPSDPDFIYFKGRTT